MESGGHAINLLVETGFANTAFGIQKDALLFQPLPKLLNKVIPANNVPGVQWAVMNQSKARASLLTPESGDF